MPGVIKDRGKSGVKAIGITHKKKAPIKSASKVNPKPKPKQKTTSSSKTKVAKKVKPNCKPKMSQSEKRRRAKNMERLKEIFVKFSLLAGMGILALGCMTALKILKNMN